MPRVTLTATQKQDRAFLAALRYGQAMRGERDLDTAQIIPSGKQRTYYNRIKDPGRFTLADLRVLAKRYFTDRQLCEAVGIEYHGGTP